MQMQALNRVIIATCLLGIYISIYTLNVEIAAEKKTGYKAYCDISSRVSCSRVLTSKYSKGLGFLDDDSPFKLPNCVYGVIFYSAILFLTTFDLASVVRVQIFISMVSVGVCIYLAYLLVLVLRDFCIVCVSSYVVNILVTYLLFKKYTALVPKKQTPASKKIKNSKNKNV